MDRKTLNILKWVGIALACLSTVFSVVIVGSHLSGRLVGMGKVGIIGTIGADMMAIICAWLVVAKEKQVAGVAMLCQIILTGILLINASIALDLDWQETLANKASERRQSEQKLVAEENRKTLEVTASAAKELAKIDRQAARAFVKTGPSKPLAVSSPEAAQESGPLDISKMSIYERYGLTVVPLFLGLLTVIALGLAAHSGSDDEQPVSNPSRSRGGFAPPRSHSEAYAERQAGKDKADWI